jgi:BMFP domain-containing protein YqiC
MPYKVRKIMLDPKVFDEAAKKLFESLPPSLQNFEKEIEKKFKETLQMTFAKLDLVTREEFDIQAKVLARTREKLDALEHQLDKLQPPKK